MKLHLGKHVLDLDRPVVMGILNITPDSFSDGGRFIDPGQALRQAESMQIAGAGIIDVGGESTRPGAAPVSTQEELDRVLPVIEVIAAEFDVAISVDTSNPEVMQSSVAAGAAMVNDVHALRRDGALEAAAGLDAAICLMHMQGTPAEMQLNPQYDDLPREVIDFLDTRVQACLSAGISRERLVVDPGIGFGKSDQHNLRILAELQQFRELGLPLLVGLSRKQTLGNLTGRAVDERVPAGIAAAVIAMSKGANIIRTHDVGATADALRVVIAIRQAGQEQ